MLLLDINRYTTERYRPEPGFKPRASRLTYERSTTELSRSIQFCYLNLGFFLITLVSYRVCGLRSATLEPYRVCRGAGVRGCGGWGVRRCGGAGVRGCGGAGVRRCGGAGVRGCGGCGGAGVRAYNMWHCQFILNLGDSDSDRDQPTMPSSKKK